MPYSYWETNGPEKIEDDGKNKRITRMQELKGWYIDMEDYLCYPLNQPYSWVDGGLSLREVVEKIEQGEFTPRNTLTMDLWARCVAPKIPEEYLLGKGGFHKEEPETWTTFPLKYTIDAPAWALVKDYCNERVYVCAKGNDEQGIPSIGAIDHKVLLEEDKVQFAEGLKSPLVIPNPVNCGLAHPSRYETVFNYISDFGVNNVSGLYTDLISEGYARIWNAGSEIKPMVIGAPTLIIGGGGEQIFSMNNLADNNCSKKFGVIMVYRN